MFLFFCFISEKYQLKTFHRTNNPMDVIIVQMCIASVLFNERAAAALLHYTSSIQITTTIINKCDEVENMTMS